MEYNIIHNCDFLDNELPDKCAQLIIADPPYFEVKGDFDFVWDSFDDYLKDVEKWAKECKRILAYNGTLFWYGDAKKIAYSQIILDKQFDLLNSLVWENTNPHKQQIRFSDGLRSFAPLTERILLYSQRDLISENYLKNKNPFSIYLKEEFSKAKITNKEIAKLFPSKTGGLTGCVSNWLNGDNVITEIQYQTIKEYLNYKYLNKKYEKLKAKYEKLRRPFNNSNHYGDVIRLPNYETSRYEHDTVKPEKLTIDLINTCSRENDLVIVPFAGSGTECAMSVREGRRFIGYEIDPKYVEIATKRVKKELMQPKLF